LLSISTWCKRRVPKAIQLTTHVPLPHDCIILDACCILNLYASGHMGDVLESIPKPLAVASYVLEEETLWIYDRPDDDVRQAKKQVDLQPFIAGGLLRVVLLESEAEETTFIDFAAVLGDDGEAITGAIALHRNWAFGTHDRKARSFFSSRETPQLELVSTPELIKYWADTVNPSPELVRNALKSVRVRALYEPGPRHPLSAWWHRFLGNQ